MDVGESRVTEWSLVYDGFDPQRERLREALCTVGNGYVASRGAAPEAPAGDIHYPGTYLAGGYNRLETTIAGRTVENEDLVNLPNWLVFAFRPRGEPWFELSTAELLEYRQELDLRHGVLVRHIRYVDSTGRRTRVTQRRFMHMEHPHLAGLQTTFVAENWSGELEVCSGLDGRVTNAGVKRYRQLAGRHLRTLEQGPVDGVGIALEVETVQSGIRIAQAARTRVVDAAGEGERQRAGGRGSQGEGERGRAGRRGGS
jgi:trehalose/maltose hydrolase-like predicted phosphorylase